MVDLPVLDLSIVIVSWNTKDLLDQCLASVFADRTGGTVEVWVVDNASSDGSPEMVEGKYPQVRLIRNETNPGFASANNQAIRQACG
ncbi:MAG: glycosyltransferase, partial [Chloroflexi bacterium]